MNIRAAIGWKLRNASYRLVPTLARSKTSRLSQNYLLQGSGRSGTTWVAETLAKLMQAVWLDEPLKNSNSKDLQAMGFSGWGEYLPTGSRHAEAEAFFRQLLLRQNYNPNWTRASALRIARSEAVLHKFIRAQFLLPWLMEQYPQLPPALLLIRNPYAVVGSQLSHRGWGKGQPLQLDQPVMPPQEGNNRDLYAPWADLFASCHYRDEIYALRWAIENKHLLDFHRSQPERSILMAYEQLLEAPEQHYTTIYQRWFPGQQPDFSRVSFNKTSKSGTEGTAGEQTAASIRRRIAEPGQEERITAILRATGMGDLYQYNATTGEYDLHLSP